MLLKYQHVWVDDTSSIKVIEKSRRIGISYATAYEAVKCASMGVDVWYIGYDEKMCKEFIGDCLRWCAFLEQCGIVKVTSSTLTQVRFADAKISALSSNPRTLRGKRGYIILDEAAFHDDLHGILKSAIAITMWGGRVAIISTHFGATNPFAKLCEDIRTGKRPFSLHRVTLDDALDDGLYERICWAKNVQPSDTGKHEWRKELFEEYGEFADEELLCIPDNLTSTYFSHALLVQCMQPCGVHRFDFTDDVANEVHTYKTRAVSIVDQIDYAQKPEQVTIGVDFGRSGDITAIAIMNTSRALVSSPLAFVELHNAPFKLQEEILHAVVRDLGCVVGIGCDGTGNGAFVAEVMQQTYGFLADNVSINNKWYAEQFGALKEAMQSKRFYLPQDRDVLSDMLHVRIIDGIPKIPKEKNKSATASGGRQRTRHGDAAVSFALAIQQVNSKCLGNTALYVHERKNRKFDEKDENNDKNHAWF